MQSLLVNRFLCFDVPSKARRENLTPFVKKDWNKKWRRKSRQGEVGCSRCDIWSVLRFKTHSLRATAARSRFHSLESRSLLHGCLFVVRFSFNDSGERRHGRSAMLYCKTPCVRLFQTNSNRNYWCVELYCKLVDLKSSCSFAELIYSMEWKIVKLDKVTN